MSNSDREFLQGHEEARVYISGLAEYPGDPRAYVSGRADVRKVCEERGWGCRGSVNVPVADREPSAEIGVAEDLVDQAVERRLAKESELARKDPGEVRHETRQQIKPHWAK